MPKVFGLFVVEQHIKGNKSMEQDAARGKVMLMHAEAQESPFAHNYYECAADRLRKNDHRK